ncbi:unnamed protein product [Symbiodinium natans]|uniref:NADP-dependent oxidoreductase domain-containing protein n=1 Tax=Symbiodinium natans TaxID=878477 RepID=A0A812LZZ7_9DINO|nr:unnamed protein product [Symbiodinium natans]
MTIGRRQSRLLVALALCLGLSLWSLPLPSLAAFNSAFPRRAALGALGALGTAPAAAGPTAPRPPLKPPAPASGTISGGVLPLTIGLGTCLVSEGDVTRQVSSALDVGYRVIDTAQRYGNEAGIGLALKAAFEKGLSRDEVFVTTKVWPSNYGFDKAISSVQDSAKKLGLEAIDLVLPHWPGVSTDFEAAETNFQLRQQTWKALERMKKDGLVKQIGVSNYNDRHLTELLDYAETLPMASQFEIHPFNTRESLVQKCKELGIRVNAYSPLGGKGNPNQVTDKLLSLQLLQDIGAAHGKTPAQLAQDMQQTILRWHLQRGVTPIPKASSAQRLQENFDVFDFKLSDEEMQEISELDRRRFAVMNSEVFL